MLSRNSFFLNVNPIILLDIKPLITIKPSWPSGLRRWADFPVVDWRGVGSNPAGNINFHFEFFAPSLFRTGQRSRCKWNQACPFTWSHSCFRPQIWFIIQGLVYKYLQYSFNIILAVTHKLRISDYIQGRVDLVCDLKDHDNLLGQFGLTSIYPQNATMSLRFTNT